MAPASTNLLGFKPFPHQMEAHHARKRMSVLVWHRRGGKTVFSVVELFLAALACELPMGEFGIIGPTLKQEKKNAWKYFKAFAKRIPGAKISETELSITLPHNGAKIRIYGADNPDGIRGDYFDGVVLDEVALMKFSTWGEVVRPMLADRRGWAIFIGTPKGVNLFSARYYAALQLPDWYADLRRWSDTGIISDEEIASMRQDMTEAEWEQEMECSFAASSVNSLIPFDSALEATRRILAPGSYRFAPRILGVDVAREGDDRSCIFPRQGLTAFLPTIFEQQNSTVVGDKLAQMIEAWRPHAVFVDSTGGWGGGVIDRVEHLGHEVIPVNFSSSPLDPQYRNRRTEIWWLLRKWILAGGALPSEVNLPGLVAELTAPKYEHSDANGKIALQAKSEFKKLLGFSPDLADALALTFSAPVLAADDDYQGSGDDDGGAGVGRCATEFDPQSDLSAVTSLEVIRAQRLIRRRLGHQPHRLAA